MAMTRTVVEATQNSILYRLTEAATAAATLQLNIAADLVANGVTAGPLFDLVNTERADQAAARAAFEPAADVETWDTANAPAGATAGGDMTLDANVSGGGAGNFRLDATAVKAANGDTLIKMVRIALRHSIID